MDAVVQSYKVRYLQNTQPLATFKLILAYKSLSANLPQVTPIAPIEICGKCVCNINVMKYRSLIHIMRLKHPAHILMRHHCIMSSLYYLT